MLILSVFINEEHIETLKVWNTGKQMSNMHIYQIVEPRGHDKHPILHDRSRGWRGLAIKALQLIEFHNNKKKNK